MQLASSLQQRRQPSSLFLAPWDCGWQCSISSSSTPAPPLVPVLQRRNPAHSSTSKCMHCEHRAAAPTMSRTTACSRLLASTVRLALLTQLANQPAPLSMPPSPEQRTRGAFIRGQVPRIVAGEPACWTWPLAHRRGFAETIVGTTGWLPGYSRVVNGHRQDVRPRGQRTLMRVLANQLPEVLLFQGTLGHMGGRHPRTRVQAQRRSLV